jgi:hypothetical protein
MPVPSCASFTKFPFFVQAGTSRTSRARAQKTAGVFLIGMAAIYTYAGN